MRVVFHFSWILVFIFSMSCTSVKVVKSFKSPEDTFATWKGAAERLDFETLIACYTSPSQQGVRKEIEQTSEEGVRAMRDETRKTHFKIEKIVYEKDKAYLRTTRRFAENEDIEVLVMIKEGQNWKLVP